MKDRAMFKNTKTQGYVQDTMKQNTRLTKKINTEPYNWNALMNVSWSDYYLVC